MGSTLVAHGATWDFHPRQTRESFQAAYEKNPIIAERDYAANPPKSIQSALPDPDVVDRKVNTKRKNPVKTDGSFEEWFKGDPVKEYYLHIDLSKSNDATGMGMCHFEMDEGKVVMDLIHNIDPSSTWELSFERIYQLILQLKELGFNLKLVTFDTWQSYHMVERLQNHDIEAGFYSVDKGTQAYDTLISTLLLGNLDYYFQERFVTELKHIKLIGGTKYDHEKKRSKDTSDGVAGCVTKCVLANSGLALRDKEVEAILHEDTFLNLQEDEGMGIWTLGDSGLDRQEQRRKRVLRLDGSETELLIVLGWHDTENDKLRVDEYLVWRDFTNKRGLSYFTSFMETLMKTVTIPVISTNDMVPMEIIQFLQESGAQVSSPLAAGGTRYRRKRFARTQKVNDFTIRRLVSVIKKGNITVPSNDALVKDLKHISTENQKNRFYAGALAGWVEYATKEISFGTTNIGLPKARVGVSTTAGSIANRLGGSKVPVSKRTKDEISGVRERYRNTSYDNSKNKARPTDGRRAFPRSLRGGR